MEIQKRKNTSQGTTQTPTAPPKNTPSWDPILPLIPCLAEHIQLWHPCLPFNPGCDSAVAQEMNADPKSSLCCLNRLFPTVGIISRDWWWMIQCYPGNPLEPHMDWLIPLLIGPTCSGHNCGVNPHSLTWMRFPAGMAHGACWQHGIGVVCWPWICFSWHWLGAALN